MIETFLAFLRLGLTCFGGPVAHIGYFREAFVARRRWLDEESYAGIVGFCQFLPGPASSQVAMVLGWRRAGYPGLIAAWLGFTLPSALLMAGFALLLSPEVANAPWVHGLKLAAVAVVAQALWSMARTLTPDLPRAAMAVVAAVAVMLLPGAVGQVAVIAAAAVTGGLLLTARPVMARPVPVPRHAGLLLALFFVLLLGLPLLAPLHHLLALFDAFYRSGALVFGGGHVVLPLLQDAVVAPGWISAGSFLAGYGAAQALPGPLFSIAAYLGALLNQPPNGLAGAAIALAGISLPGLLLVAGILPFWDRLRGKEKVQAAVRGVNATVVGILAAALYDPLWITAVGGVADALMAAFGFALLTTRRVPVLLTVALVTAAETALAFL